MAIWGMNQQKMSVSFYLSDKVANLSKRMSGTVFTQGARCGQAEGESTYPDRLTSGA